MTRGRKSTTGVDAAGKIAKRRGTVMRFCPENGTDINFVIRNFSRIVFVRVKRTPLMRCKPQDIEAGFPEEITSLRSIQEAAHCIVCELWTYSKNGTWRFFRLEGNGLVEIDVEGTPMKTTGHGKRYAGKKS